MRVAEKRPVIRLGPFWICELLDEIKED